MERVHPCRCPVAPMLTDDNEGVYRQDNHAWLFGWTGGTVFQARISTPAADPVP